MKVCDIQLFCSAFAELRWLRWNENHRGPARTLLSPPEQLCNLAAPAFFFPGVFLAPLACLLSRPSLWG